MKLFLLSICALVFVGVFWANVPVPKDRFESREALESMVETTTRPVTTTTTTIITTTTDVEVDFSVALVGDSTAWNLSTHLGNLFEDFVFVASPGCAFVDADVEIIMNSTMPGGFTTCPDWRTQVADAVSGADVVVFRADGTPLADMGKESVLTPEGRRMLGEVFDVISANFDGPIVGIAPSRIALDGNGWLVNEEVRTNAWSKLLRSYSDWWLDPSKWVENEAYREDGAHLSGSDAQVLSEFIYEFVVDSYSSM